MKVPQVRNEASTEPVDDPTYSYARKRGWIAYGLHLAGGFGMFGLHRFYLGFVPSAKIQLALAFLWIVSIFTIGHPVSSFLQVAVFVWYVVDLFLIPRLLRERNAEIAEVIARGRGTATL